MVSRFDSVNAFYIQDLAAQIAAVREDQIVDYMLALALLIPRIAEVNAQIEKAVEKSAVDIRDIYTAAVDETYNDQRFKGQIKDLPEATLVDISKHRMAVERATAATMRRLVAANNVSQTYQQAVNKAVISRNSGLDNQDGLMRSTVRTIGRTGIVVTGEDGKNRSIESTITNAILDGVRDVQQYANDAIGADLKFDAVEISVHDDPAPDHEPIQGNIFMRAEFNKLQGHEAFVDVDGTRYPAQVRAIGELNCRHLAFPFSTKDGVRRYSPNDLRIMRKRNKQGRMIDGKHYTLYEARQYANRLRAERGRQESVLLAAQKAGDKVLEQKTKERINAIDMRIAQINNARTPTTIS